MRKSRIRCATRRVLALVLALAFVMSQIQISSQFVKAADTVLARLSVASGYSANSIVCAKDPYGTDIIADTRFEIPEPFHSSGSSGYRNLKYNVSVELNSFDATTGLTAGLYAMNQKDGGWKDIYSKNITSSGTKIELSLDLSSFSNLGTLGVRFTGGKDGSVVKFSILSATITGEKSSNSGTSTTASMPSSGNESSVEGVSASINKISGNSDWAEYNYVIKNESDLAVKGVLLKIPYSGTIDKLQSWNCSAKKMNDGNYIIIKHSKEITAGATYTCDKDTKFGYAGGASLGIPSVELITSENEDLGSALKYKLTGTTQALSAEETPVGKHGALNLANVEGYSAPIIVDEAGEPFQLRGASTHGMHWDSMKPYVNKGSFQSLRDEWGVNMIRLVNYVTQGGYTEGSQDKLDKLDQEGVKAATELGMYVIIDWHIHAENPIPKKAQAIEFFKKYAKMYKDYKNVIFEICNEPTGINWYTGEGDDLYTYCKDVTKVIRDCGNNSLVICGTNTWSQDVDDVAQKPLAADGFKNVLYTFHFYSGSHYEDKMEKVRKATKDGTPIFVTEFGICDASGNGGYDTDNADAWIKLCDENNISISCWSLCNKDESASYLLPSCTKTTGGWVESDLSTTGIWLVNTYRAHEETENKTSPTSITLNETKVSLKSGDKTTLNVASVLPEEASKAVVWSSSDEKVVGVSNGTVTAVAPGTATITAKSKLNDKITAVCEVTVTKKIINKVTFPTATGTATAGDKLSALKLSVLKDDYGTFTWENPNLKLTSQIDKANVVYTLSDSNCELDSTVEGVNKDKNKVVRSISLKDKIVKSDIELNVPDTVFLTAGKTYGDIDMTTWNAGNVKGTFTLKDVKSTDVVHVTENNRIITVVFTPESTDYKVKEIKVVLKVTKEAYDKTPVKPVIKNKMDTTVTLENYTGDTKVEYGYRLQGEDTYNWQATPVFTGLASYNTYEFAMRFAANDIHAASNASEATIVVTNVSDVHKIDVSKLDSEGYVEAHDGTITYDEENNTLTLKDAESYTITGAKEGLIVVFPASTNSETKHDLKMQKASIGKIKSLSAMTLSISGDNVVATGIEAEKAITIKQDNSENASVGTLTATAENKEDARAAAISADTIEIESGNVVASSLAGSAISAEKEISLKGGNVIVSSAEGQPDFATKKLMLAAAQVSTVDMEKKVEYGTDNIVDHEGEKVQLVTVCYYMNDGTTMYMKTETTKGADITLPAVPKKDGMKGNWKLKDAESVYDKSTYTVSSDTTEFVANYMKIEGTVSISPSDTTDVEFGYEEATNEVTIVNESNITLDSVEISLESYAYAQLNGQEETFVLTNLKPGVENAKKIPVTFKRGLKVGTYNVEVLLKASELGENGSNKTSIVFSVRKQSVVKPSKPELLSKTEDMITLKAVDGAKYGISIANGTIQWQESNVFDQLDSDTEYQFYIQLTETETTAASEVSDVTTLRTDKKKEVVEDSEPNEKSKEPENKSQNKSDVEKSPNEMSATNSNATTENTSLTQQVVSVVPKLTTKNILLQKGKTFVITTRDAKATIESVSYMNAKSEKIVSISSNGKVKAKNVGTAKLKVIVKYENETFEKIVTVKVQKEAVVTLKKKYSTITMKKKQKCNLVNGLNMFSAGGMKFTVANKKIATVTSKGVVKAKKKGKTMITIKSGKTVYKITIKVK